MKTPLVQIGNSRSIRIPKAFLEQCQLRDAVELELRDGHPVVRLACLRRGLNPGELGSIGGGERYG